MEVQVGLANVKDVKRNDPQFAVESDGCPLGFAYAVRSRLSGNRLNIEGGVREGPGGDLH